MVIIGLQSKIIQGHHLRYQWAACMRSLTDEHGIILTAVLFCTISKTLWINGQIFTVDRGAPFIIITEIFRVA